MAGQVGRDGKRRAIRQREVVPPGDPGAADAIARFERAQALIAFVTGSLIMRLD